MNQTLSPNLRLKSNNNHSRKMSYYRHRNKDLASQIFDYIKENGFKLPSDYYTFSANPEFYCTDYETGEIRSDILALAKAGYNLRKSNKAVYALFQKGSVKRQQMLSCWYSKHRLDHIWNYRKSKMIRKLWTDYLRNHPELTEKTTPKHLTLTVSHKGGVWQGKRFYAREMLKEFNEMRKAKGWKYRIFGGEYGVEISKSKDGHGLHIHLHVLCFQYKTEKGREVYNWIKKNWKERTGAKFVHYETLYIHKKDESGKWIKEYQEALTFDTDTETDVIYREAREVRKKFYLQGDWFDSLNADAKLDTYVSGVMECIKYHFKNDALLEHGSSDQYDLPLVAEVLENSHYLRMYSKFGGFYGDKELNYSRLQTKAKDFWELTDEEEEEAMINRFLDPSVPEIPKELEEHYKSDAFLQALEEDAAKNLEEPVDDFINHFDPFNMTDEQEDKCEELTANSEITIENLVNPFTSEPAKAGEFKRVMSLPEWITHGSKYQQYRPTVQEDRKYFEIEDHWSMKDIMRLIAKSQYRELLKSKSYYDFVEMTSHLN